MDRELEDFRRARREPVKPKDPSLEAEQGLLGCILLDSACLAECDGIPESAFRDERHRVIWSAFKSMHSRGEPIDTSTVFVHLNGNGDVAAAGGAAYIGDLPDKAPVVGNLHHWLEKVQEDWTRRRLQQLGEDASGGDIEALLSRARKLTDGRRAKVQLADRRLNWENPPPEAFPVYSVAGITICTAGNLTSVTAAAKAGKSAFLGAMLAAPMVPEDFKRDTLGVFSRNALRKAILHFDTEHSQRDHWEFINTVVRRAGLTEPPPWLLSYLLTGLNHHDAWQFVRDAMAEAASRSGLHSVFIDGTADLVADVNRQDECNPLVAELHGLAMLYSCPIIGVIHTNPTSGKSQNAKTRGHLGSQLERKAETNLKLEKKKEVTVVWSDKQRRQPIPKKSGPRFKWDTDATMHVSCMDSQDDMDAATEAKWSKARGVRDDAFGERHGMRYGELCRAIMDSQHCSESTAERRIQEMETLNLVVSIVGVYSKASSNDSPQPSNHPQTTLK